MESPTYTLAGSELGVLATSSSSLNHNNISFFVNAETEVVRIGGDGRVYWLGREVESDDDFRAAMMAMAKVMRGL